MVRKLGILLVFMMSVLHVSASAGELYEADTRQIYCFSDVLRAYVDLKDKDGNTVKKPERADAAGYIDGTKLTTRSISRFGDTEEGTADIFLVDVSGSIRNSQMGQVKNAIKTWASKMKTGDRIAVISFGDNVETLTDFSGNADEISTAADMLTNNGSKTQLYGGISHALKLASRSDADLPERKNIILITDGVNDYSGGISEGDVLSELKSSLIPVYSMWMSGSRESNAKGKGTLNSVTDYSGGELYDMSDKDIDTVYSWIKDSILDSYTIDFSYDGIQPDNNSHKFSIKVAESGKIAEDSVDFVMKSSSESSDTYTISSVGGNEKKSEKQDDNEDNSEDDSPTALLIIFVVIVLVILAAIAVVLILMRSKNNSYEDDFSQEMPVNNMNYVPTVQQYGNVSSDKTVNVNFGGEANAGGKIMILRSLTSGTAHKVCISGRAVIGRSSQCNLTLGNGTVSGRHAAVTVENGRLYIEDLGSVNGTLVNGRMISTKAELKNGDMLMLGNEEFEISF